MERLLALYEPTISSRFYTNFRFPAYNYDKLVIGLIELLLGHKGDCFMRWREKGLECLD